MWPTSSEAHESDQPPESTPPRAVREPPEGGSHTLLAPDGQWIGEARLDHDGVALDANSSRGALDEPSTRALARRLEEWADRMAARLIPPAPA